MRPLPILAVLAGGATILAGAVLVLVAATGDYDSIDWRLRTAVRWTHAGNGAAVMLAGLAFVLAGHILDTLRDQRDIAQAEQAARRARDLAADRQDAPPRPAPASTAPGAGQPSAEQLVTQHGATLGTRMHTEIQAARSRGATITMEQARARALEWMRQNGQG